MTHLSKNDKVVIVNTNDVWEDKTGVVLEQNENEIITENGEDLTEVIVKVDFPSADNEVRSIIQVFPRQNLKLVDLDEQLTQHNLTESFKNVNSFINSFIGREVIFLGLPYDEIYQVKSVTKNKVTDEEEFEYDVNDREDIEQYKNLEGKIGIITSCAIPDGFEKYDTTQNNFDRCYWNIYFKDEDVSLDALSGSVLSLVDATVLKESVEVSDAITEDPSEDFIHDYVYFLDIEDNEIPSWYFVSKIATAENTTEDAVVTKAIELKYKVYNVETSGAVENKLLVLAPKTKIEDVYSDYIDYILGTVTVTEVV